MQQTERNPENAKKVPDKKGSWCGVGERGKEQMVQQIREEENKTFSSSLIRLPGDSG